MSAITKRNCNDLIPTSLTRSKENFFINKICQFLFYLLFILLLTACDGGGMKKEKDTFHDLKSVDNISIKKLSSKRIFFGHQSVGQNIVDGVRDLMKEYPAMNLCLNPANAPVTFSTPCFLHTVVGSNGNPQSKIDNFVELMADSVGTQIDIAFFKFCYIDFNSTTDVKALFQSYLAAMDRLKKQFPSTKFIHVTAPLETSPGAVKRFIKQMMGRTDANIKRSEFNDLIRTQFDGKEPLFDLAKIESTYPDGRSATITSSDKTYQILVPEYTYDEGHLNEAGRKRVAEQLLLFLLNII